MAAHRTSSDFFVSSYINNVFDNISSSYFLHHGSLGTPLVPHILTECENCRNWSTAVRMALIAKNYMGSLLMWREKCTARAKVGERYSSL